MAAIASGYSLVVMRTTFTTVSSCFLSNRFDLYVRDC